MVRRLPFIFMLTGIVVVALFSSGLATWAAPGTDPVRQTVPTMTPTSRPGPPSTPEPPQQDTPAPVVPTPTHTWTPQPTETLPPTSELSATPTLATAASPTGTPPSLTPLPAWDFGDAPDPAFPCLLASDGARHSMVEFEWLGAGVDQEQDSRQVDADLYDDGIGIPELMACAEANLEVSVTVRDRDDPQHPYDAEHLLYLNVLVDWDGDGAWGGRISCPQGLVASEWAVRNLGVDASSWSKGTTATVIPLQLPVGPRAGQSWARFTLSYAEVIWGDDWDGRGAFAFGETEDHLLIITLPPSAPAEAPSPTSVAVATPTPAPTGSVGAAPGPTWEQTLVLFGAGLFLGIALVALLIAWRRKDWRILVGVLVAAVILLVVGSMYFGPRLARTVLFGKPVPPTPYERIIPTATMTEEATAESTSSTPEVIDTPAPDRSITPQPEAAEPTVQAPVSTPQFVIASPVPSLMSVRDRFGFGVAIAPISGYAVDQLHAGWYLNWRADLNPARPQGMEYVQMIRVGGTSFSPSGQDLERVIQNNPGSLWLIGNEPDVIWQDNTTPADYARIYHEVHTLLKSIDSTCEVAIAGITQPTPLRLQYLDLVLDAYQDLYGGMMPVDVWNVHAFILREERDSWGVDIPPGISADQGRLHELEDHDDMEIFREQIVAFRRWMKDRGERDKPLIVSEYGILLPEEYGFPYEKVRDFMYATFDYFLTASDASLGYPADGNRLVQRWAWYSLSDTVYPTGNLFDPDTGQITSLGLAYSSYTSSH